MIQCKFYIQDPGDVDTKYLLEAIVEELEKSDVQEWRAMYAFVTGRGVEALCQDPTVVKFLKNHKVSLVVGLDAVTDRYAITLLKDLQIKYSNFKVKVFLNKTNTLFHPKISHFVKAGGKHTLIIGSNNLTPGGLKNNIEAYSVVTFRESDRVSLDDWDKFINRHASELVDIDENIMSLAEKNKPKYRRRRKIEEEDKPQQEEEMPVEIETQPYVEAPPTEVKILVARVPGAGGRWHQLHLNEEIVNDFFRIKPNSSQRLDLQEVKQDGSLGRADPPRPCVMSSTNKNRKIEIGARRDEEYPSDRNTPPIIIFCEMGVRRYNYILLMPDEPGYQEMLNFTATHPSVGKGLRRVITNLEEIKNVWSSCPL